MLAKLAPCDCRAAPMLAKVCAHCASKSADVVPSLAAPTCPAMNRNSDAFTRVICEYCPSGLPRLSGFRYWTCGMGGSRVVDRHVRFAQDTRVHLRRGQQ